MLGPDVAGIPVGDPASYLPPDSASGGLRAALTRLPPGENRAQAFLRYFMQLYSTLGLLRQMPLAGAYSEMPSGFIRHAQTTRQGYLPLLVVSMPLMYLFSWAAL